MIKANLYKWQDNKELFSAQKKVKINSVFVVLFTVAIITITQCLGINVLIWAAMCIYLLTMLTAKDDDLIPFLLFFLPWSPILKITPTSISFASIATILILFKYILIKKPYIDTRLMVLFLWIFVFSFVVKIAQGYDLTLNYLMLMFMFFAFPFLFGCVKEKTNYVKCVRFFALGIISAAVTSEIFSTNPFLIRYIKIFSQEAIGVTRLCGFYGDPNFYSAQIVAAFGGLLVVLSCKEKTDLLDIILIIALIAVGVISISKSYLMCTILVFALWGIASLRKPSKFIVGSLIVSIIIFILLSSGVFDEIIAEYLARFGVATDASTLTTGRSDIWKNYLNFMLDNPLSLFFGQGCTSGAMVKKGSHNSLIQLVYQLGIFGCVILAFWIRYLFTITKNKGHKKTDFMCSVMWFVACFIMWLGLDMLFFDDFFLIIILCSLGMNYIRQYNS